MDKIIKIYNIRTSNNFYNLEDIVNNIIGSKSTKTYINKIQNKKRINSQYFISKEQFIQLLTNAKSTKSKNAIKILQENNMIPSLLNSLSFQGCPFYFLNDSDGNIWFKASDIASILGYKRPEAAIKELVNINQKKKFNELTLEKNSSIQKHTIFINKKGLRQLLIKSKLHKSIEFCKFMDIDVDFKYCFKETEIVYYLTSYFDLRNIVYELQKPIGIYRMDVYLTDYNLNIEIDELDHKDRDPKYEKKRENYIKKKLNCNTLRFNPDNENDNVINFIAKIQNFLDNNSNQMYENINYYLIQKEITKQNELDYKMKELDYKIKEIDYKMSLIKNKNNNEIEDNNNQINEEILIEKEYSNNCIDCGDVISKKAKRCTVCVYKNRFNKASINRPSLDELKNSVSQIGYVKTAAIYKVSDNTIRKWINKYEKYN